jgi:nitrite reductase/ring-hydroxylating ferredoxin subunit
VERIVDGHVVALFNVDGRYHALEGICPHQGGPLGKGSVDGPVVSCPWHGWRFDVRSGQCLFSPAVQQPTLPTRLEDGVVLVETETRNR